MKITIIKGGLRSKVGIYKWSKEEQKKKVVKHLDQINFKIE